MSDIDRVPGIPSTDDMGNAVCIWWSNLTREQRTWVYFTAAFMQADLFVLKSCEPWVAQANAEASKQPKTSLPVLPCGCVPPCEGHHEDES